MRGVLPCRLFEASHSTTLCTYWFWKWWISESSNFQKLATRNWYLLEWIQLSRQLQGLKLAFALFYLWIGMCAAMASPCFGFELFIKLAFGDRLSYLHIATAVLPVLDTVTSTLKDNKNLPARVLWLGFNLPCITMLFERKIFCTTGFVQSVRNCISQMEFIF